MTTITKTRYDQLASIADNIYSVVSDVELLKFVEILQGQYFYDILLGKGCDGDIDYNLVNKVTRLTLGDRCDLFIKIKDIVTEQQIKDLSSDDRDQLSILLLENSDFYELVTDITNHIEGLQPNNISTTLPLDNENLKYKIESLSGILGTLQQQNEYLRELGINDKIESNLLATIEAINVKINEYKEQLDPRPKLIERANEIRASIKALGLDLQTNEISIEYLDSFQKQFNSLKIELTEVLGELEHQEKIFCDKKESIALEETIDNHEQNSMADNKKNNRKSKSESSKSKLDPVDIKTDIDNNDSFYCYKNQKQLFNGEKGKPFNLDDSIVYLPLSVTKYETDIPKINELICNGKARLTKVQLTKLASLGYGAIKTPDSNDWKLITKPEDVTIYTGIEIEYQIK